VPRLPGYVRVARFRFGPARINVRAGESVTWEFRDGGVPHNVDGRGSLGDFYSGPAQQRGTWTYTFAAPGEYVYICAIHPEMVGTVVVK